MEYTTNLNLKKPDINEYYNIVEQENENADIIDEAIGKLNSDVGTEELTTEAQDCKGAINELNKNKMEIIELSSVDPSVTNVITLPNDFYMGLVFLISKFGKGGVILINCTHNSRMFTTKIITQLDNYISLEEPTNPNTIKVKMSSDTQFVRLLKIL